MIQEIFKDLRENGFVVVSEMHVHDEYRDYGEINSIEIISEENPICGWEEEDIGKYAATHSVSGGRHECVWNHYEEIFNSFIDALVYLMPIEDIVGAESYDELNERLDK